MCLGSDDEPTGHRITFGKLKQEGVKITLEEYAQKSIFFSFYSEKRQEIHCRSFDQCIDCDECILQETKGDGDLQVIPTGGARTYLYEGSDGNSSVQIIFVTPTPEQKNCVLFNFVVWGSDKCEDFQSDDPNCEDHQFFLDLNCEDHQFFWECKKLNWG